MTAVHLRCRTAAGPGSSFVVSLGKRWTLDIVKKTARGGAMRGT